MEETIVTDDVLHHPLSIKPYLSRNCFMKEAFLGYYETGVHSLVISFE